MIRAYDKLYIDHSRVTFASMLDYAVNDLEYELSEFYKLFLKSGIAEKFGSGSPYVTVGKSGIELAHSVLSANGIEYIFKEPVPTFGRSEEYWTGWALAYYQWHTGLSFRQIEKYVPIDRVISLYHPYHEMDISHFVRKMNELYSEAKSDTNLKIRRTRLNFSQNDLAESSGVPLRMIQQYEQRKRDINRARADYVLMLSRSLSCDVADLMEIEESDE